VPDSFGRQNKTRKVKFEIQKELDAKPRISQRGERSNYTHGLTEWLVGTLLLVSAEEHLSDLSLDNSFQPSKYSRSRLAGQSSGIPTWSTRIGKFPVLRGAPGLPLKKMFCVFSEGVNLRARECEGLSLTVK